MPTWWNWNTHWFQIPAPKGFTSSSLVVGTIYVVCKVIRSLAQRQSSGVTYRRSADFKILNSYQLNGNVAEWLWRDLHKVEYEGSSPSIVSK